MKKNKKLKLTKKQIEEIRAKRQIEEDKRKIRQELNSKKMTKAYIKAGYLDKKLKKLGHETYDQYISSAHWIKFKEEVLDTLFYNGCIACDYPLFDFHHLTYRRLGNECLSDVIPLCKRCHDAVHKVSLLYNIGVYDIEKSLSKVFNWSLGRVRDKIRYFLIQRYQDEFLYGKP